MWKTHRHSKINYRMGKHTEHSRAKYRVGKHTDTAQQSTEWENTQVQQNLK